jgi:hypothetical protein
MGVPPSGEIIARPMLKRACGCEQEFQYYAVDKYRAQRQAKFERTRCPACVAKLVEQQRLASTLPKKGEAFKQLPPGAKMTLARKPDGTWTGELTADGTKVDATGEGPNGVIIALTRLWLTARAQPAASTAARPATTPPAKPAPPPKPG